MKIHKVLLGLFAGLLALTGGATHAQFYEIGPANIGGQVSSLVLDNQDATRSTIYAGAATGGLFVRTTNTSVLNNLYSDLGSTAPIENLVADTTSWHKVTLKLNNEEVTLPISAMTQMPNGELILGTGDNSYILGSMYTGKMSLKGRGIYRYNPSTKELKLISYTSNLNTFGAVKALDYIYRDGTVYLFAATNTGLYRWTISDNDPNTGWNSNATLVQLGEVDEFVVARTLNVAYFSIGNQLWKVSNLTSANPAAATHNISASNTAFADPNVALKLAIAPSDNRYLYVMVINADGESENVYLTTNGQAWTTLTTETIYPIWPNNNGKTCGTIAVDPTNPKRVIIAGTNIWIGQGYVEGANYQWTKTSYSELELNRGDYMGTVFISPYFVHSGIHQILSVYSETPVYQTSTETIHHTYYMATDAGVYSTTNDFRTFNNINLGLNNVQIADLAVCPDGSVISGAAFNGCPFIGSRNTHNGGTPLISWYDNGAMGNFNHNANVLWTGSGNKVAASSFYQILPQSRRNIYTTSQGMMGRSFADYFDYTNTQTWTIGDAFLSNEYTGHVGNIFLWESANDQLYKDSIKVAIDPLGYIFRKRSAQSNIYDTIWLSRANPLDNNGVRFEYRDSVIDEHQTITIIDTIPVGTGRGTTFQLQSGDTAVFTCRGNAEYPFKFGFSQSFLNNYIAQHEGMNKVTVGDSFLIKSPVVSRALAVVAANNSYDVIYTWTPNDFSHVWDNNGGDKLMTWFPIFRQAHGVEGDILDNDIYPRDAVLSTDGYTAYISVYHTTRHESQLYRLRGFENVNFHQQTRDIYPEIHVESSAAKRKVKQSSIRGGDNWFSRPISHIAVDPRPGEDRIVITFEDYNDSYDNVVIINHASDTNGLCTIEPIGIIGSNFNYNNIPAYSAFVERTSGDIWVGTAEGVFIYNNQSHTWSQYSHLKGVPVTSIVQQYHERPVLHNLTHTGINENKFIFAKTKWPGAIYIGTYGRGIFLDTSLVTDPVNEICNPEDFLDIPRVNNVGLNSVSVYPNPVSGNAHLALTATEAGRATLRIYDLNGRVITNRDLGYAVEGEQVYTISTDGLSKGMYLINVVIGGHTAATKMLVR